MRAAAITISDKGSVGEREDRSGPVLVEALQEMGAEVVYQTIIPDEPEQIGQLLSSLADQGTADVVITTGGTGVAPRDRTPEGTRPILDYEIPGIAEALRADGYRKTPLAVISRGLAGVRKECLIINLPGSPRAVQEGMETLSRIVPHTVQMLLGQNLEHKEHHHHG